MQTFLYPAALQVKRIPNAGGSRPRIAYVIRNGHLTQAWDEVAREARRRSLPEPWQRLPPIVASEIFIESMRSRNETAFASDWLTSKKIHGASSS